MHIQICTIAAESQRIKADLLCLHQVIFYCHFPDLLLSTRSSVLHSLYRLPLDWAEQTSTGAADCILVNSKFTRGGAMKLKAMVIMRQLYPCNLPDLLNPVLCTRNRGVNDGVAYASSAGVFAETFRRLQRRGIVPGVLYPAVDIPSAEQLAADRQRAAAPELAQLLGGSGCFLSINRFERKKVLCALCPAPVPLGLCSSAWQLCLRPVVPSQPTPAIYTLQMPAAAAAATVQGRHWTHGIEATCRTQGVVLGCRTWSWRCGGSRA
jgi:hypothetical protein